MATHQLILSNKTDANGKSLVSVRITISRTNRPCIATGVYVSPKWFKVAMETRNGKGKVYEIKVPKQSRLNKLEVTEANEAKAKLEQFTSRLDKVWQALEGNEEVTRAGIEEAMTLTRDTATERISYSLICDRRALMKKTREKEVKKDERTFFEWFEQFLERKDYSDSRKRLYRVLERILGRYEGYVRMTDKKRKKFRLDIHSMDKDTLYELFDYMKNEKALADANPRIFEKLLETFPVECKPKHKKVEISERGHNVMVVRKKQLKAFFNWLHEQHITENRPFEGIEIGAEKYDTEPYYLTREERDKVAAWDFTDNTYLATQRDIFIFHCFVGCRVSDLTTLTESNLNEDSEGTLWVEYIPRKTGGDKVRVPITNAHVRELINKYRGTDKKGRLFPMLFAQKYNGAIKSVLQECGITRTVQVKNTLTGEVEGKQICDIASSHMARRTFVGLIYETVSDPSIIGSMSGHVEGSRAFARYRRISDENKKKAASVLQ